MSHHPRPSRSVAALWTCVATTAAFLVRHHTLGRWDGLVLFGVATASYAALLRLELRRRALSARAVFAAVLVLMVFAVAVRPVFSRDLWAYADYGRVVAVHHASPYTHAPSEFPNDPAFARMNPVFANTRSVYGPLFTGVSAAGMYVARSPLGMRLFFQALAALSMLGVLAMVWRRTRDPALVALAGLHPVVITGVVNGGHNDALLALFVVAGVALAAHRRDALAGGALALAASIKIVALLGLGGLVVLTLRARGVRAAARTAAAGAVVTVAGYVAVGGVAATRPLRAARSLVSVTSIWDVVRHRAFVPTASLVVVIALALVYAWRARDDAVHGTTLALGAYLLAGAYILPWYVAWVLPLAALTADRALQLGAVVLAFAFQFVYTRAGTGAGAHLHGVLGTILHVLQVAAIALLLVRSRDLRRPTAR